MAAGLLGSVSEQHTTSTGLTASPTCHSARAVPPAVSVVIPTYNRCNMLSAALGCVLAQRAGGVPYEVLVVDNKSTDRTAEVVQSHARHASIAVQYVSEAKQGVAHARNAGIAAARAPIVAFLDDDVWVASDWVMMVKQALDENLDVDYVGGKVLPQWPRQPPAWLTKAHWSPLAILDRGDRRIYITAKHPFVVLGANLAVRRDVFDRVGRFAADFQHLRDAACGGAEDHELQLRIWTAGGVGLYVPEMVATADVQPERLTKRYHRQWHSVHGHLCSLMRVEETSGPGGELMPERQEDLQLFGVPASLHRQQLRACVLWLWTRLRGNGSLSFEYETQVRYYMSYIRTRQKQTRAHSRQSPLFDLATFVVALLRKKRRQSRSARRDPQERPITCVPEAEPHAAGVARSKEAAEYVNREPAR